MSGTPGLEDRLARLAAAGVAGDRGWVLRATDPAALLRRILVEIDTVLMPRRLTLTGADERVLTLDAANRRLLHLGIDAEPGAPLDPDDPEHALHVRGAVEGLAGGDGVTLAIGPLDDGATVGAAGISARALAEAWGMSLNPPVQEDPLGGFLDRAGARLAAWLRIEDGNREDSGSADAVDALVALADTRLAPPGVFPDEPWQMTVFLPADPAAPACAEIAAGRSRLLIAFAPADLGTLTDLWRSAVAG